MFAINAGNWRWGNVRREEVGEGQSKKLSPDINIASVMALALWPSNRDWNLGSAL